jgi:hypothetical protein
MRMCEYPYVLNDNRHAVRVSPQFSNRMIEASRSILNRYIPDIYLYSDVYKGEESGKYAPFQLLARLTSRARELSGLLVMDFVSWQNQLLRLFLVLKLCPDLVYLQRTSHSRLPNRC